MADHPNGIYQYTSVNIPTNVTVTFIPNANNTPVFWLVQGNVVINGTVDVCGQNASGPNGGSGGPGGWAGGGGGSPPRSGQGPGGGGLSTSQNWGVAGGGSFGSQGGNGNGGGLAGQVYGNSFLLPLIGGSGGGGCSGYGGGGGGGGILIATSNGIRLNGQINALGGSAAVYSGGDGFYYSGGGGSGGAIRLVTSSLGGAGMIRATGGGGPAAGGAGRVRVDAFQDTFAGGISGILSEGFQPIILPTAGQAAQLTITSIGGVPVSPSPTGLLVTPDAILSAQQNDPIPITVSCANLPVHTLITVSVKPVSGWPVSATGYNDSGTLASSAATVRINIPRGGGLIYASAATH